MDLFVVQLFEFEFSKVSSKCVLYLQCCLSTMLFFPPFPSSWIAPEEENGGEVLDSTLITPENDEVYLCALVWRLATFSYKYNFEIGLGISEHDEVYLCALVWRLATFSYKYNFEIGLGISEHVVLVLSVPKLLAFLPGLPKLVPG